MAEMTLTRSGALAGHRSTAVSGLPSMTRFSVRGAEGARAKLAGCFGVDLPTEACRAAEADGKAALWLGPDEWLLIAPDGEAEALTRSIAEALGSEPHSFVDVSHRNTGFLIEGDGAATLLNEGCPLDLDLAACPAGFCTRTVLGKSEVVLWRRAETTFHLECWRSFAVYVRQFLSQAAENQD